MNIEPDKIGFDFDGVIADIGEAFLRLACEEHNYCSFKLEDITSFQVENCIDIPESVVHKIFTDILEDSIATGLLPIEGAINTLNRLGMEAGFTIITARSLDKPVSAWLDKYLSPAVCRKIHLIAMRDHDEKVQYIKKMDLEYFIDDRAETCAMVAEAGHTPLLFRQPWNSRWNTFTTVHNWQEISNFINLSFN